MMTSGNITIFAALKKAVEILSENRTIETPRLDAEVLLCYVLKCERIFLAINNDKAMNKTQTEAFFSLIKRRKNNEPVSYITGVREFMSLEFEVKSGVLIPRPDTEILVEKVIELFQEKHAKILDVCTGSGAVAVSLAHYLKDSEVYALDKYDICVETARENAARNNVDVTVSKADIFDDFCFNTQFDCIVSNPPYIEREILKTLSSDVKDYEPMYALNGGDDGLIFYRRITELASAFLKKGGILAYEIGYNQSVGVTEIIEEHNRFGPVQVIKDLSGLDRVVFTEKR